LAGCEFMLPADLSEGHNDINYYYNSITFSCPPGSSGTPVTMKAGVLLSATQLPPTTEIVHCT
jgi:hypothetical protein